MFLVFGRIRINKPYDVWEELFLAHRAARLDAGIEDVLHAPVIGRQEVMYVVRTAHPRRVHDLMYTPEARAHIEASGHIPGTEEYTVCEET